MPNPTDVPIQIDRKPFKLESPTTGAILYGEASIPDGYDLWREVRGPGDDEFIAREAPEVELGHGDHFYSAQSTLNPGVHDG